MIRRFEDISAIGALPLEDRAGIVQRMGEHVYLSLAPLDHMTIKPDPSVAIVECLSGHGVFLSPRNESVWFLGDWGYMNWVDFRQYASKKAELCQYC